MKTSIFDMNFVLPPVVEMTEVEKDMPLWTGTMTLPDPCMPVPCPPFVRRTHENIHI